MPIRFSCPSCRQPIEIDDQWAGQSVACPYCNRVVTAPATSTWSPESQIPQAAPAARPFQPSPPPPPGGFSYPPTPAPMSGTDAAGRRSASAAWALAFTLAGAGFILVALISFKYTVEPVIIDKLGQPPTTINSPEFTTYNEKLVELLNSGGIPTPGIAVLAILLGLTCSLAGVVFAIRTAIRRERRGLGIALAVFAFLCVACQGIFSLLLVALTMSSRLPH